MISGYVIRNSGLFPRKKTLPLQVVTVIKLTLFAVFQESPEGNNFQLANTTHANIKIRTKEDLLACRVQLKTIHLENNYSGPERMFNEWTLIPNG